jgi:hypothetical protein
MSLKLFLTIKSVVCFVFGIPIIIAPGVVFPIYGVSLDAPGEFLARLMGCFMVGVGLICWSGGRAEDSILRRAILLSLFICDTAGAVVSLFATLGGLTNALGWLNVALWLFLAAGLGYFRFLAKG